MVEGTAAAVEVVSADDPRLVSRPPLPEVRLALSEDPERLNRREAGGAVSGPDGWFELRPDVAGAGVLRIDAGLEARRKGFAPAAGDLPPARTRQARAGDDAGGPGPGARGPGTSSMKRCGRPGPTSIDRRRPARCAPAPALGSLPHA